MGYVARRSRRFLPRHSVTVALLDEDYPVAYGVIKDISEAGACIITDRPLGRDRNLTLKMSFYRTGMLAAGGRVVWSEAGPRETTAQGTRHGVEFTRLTTAERRRLRRLLGASTFGAVAD